MSLPRPRTRVLGAVLAVGLCLLLVNRPGTERPAGAAPAAPLAVSTTTSAHGTVGGHPVWAHFADPRAHGGRDATIHTELIRLIDNASPGSTIHGTIHSLGLESLSQHLVAAQGKGVHVKIVIDGKNEHHDPDDDDPAVTIIKRLDEVKFCHRSSGGTGCVASSGDSDMHSKLFTFSSTTDPYDTPRTQVSWFGSANMNDHSGTERFNNSVTVYGDPALYAGFERNFAHLYAEKHFPGNDYYDFDSGRGYYDGAAGDAYLSPEGSGQTDTIASRLDDIVPDANCKLRVGMSNVTGSRPKLVALVKNFRAAGCQVQMLVNAGSDGPIDMDEGVYDAFLKAGVQIRKLDHVHDKYFVAYGKIDGTYQFRVYTGSQQWTEDGLNQNDEVFVKMAAETSSYHPLYTGFIGHFYDGYDHGTVCTTDKKNTCYKKTGTDDDEDDD